MEDSSLLCTSFSFLPQKKKLILKRKFPCKKKGNLQRKCLYAAYDLSGMLKCRFLNTGFVFGYHTPF